MDLSFLPDLQNVEFGAKLASVIVVLRTIWSLFGPKLVEKSPRWRSVVEGLAAAGPDLGRATVKIVHALTGKDFSNLLGPSDSARLARELEAAKAEIASLKARLGESTSTPPSSGSGASAAAALLVVSMLGMGATGCPTVLPEVSNCTPRATRCHDGVPQVCSSTGRWHNAVDNCAQTSPPSMCCLTRSPYGNNVHACVPSDLCIAE